MKTLLALVLGVTLLTSTQACDRPSLDLYGVMAFLNIEQFEEAMVQNLANGYSPIGSMSVTFNSVLNSYVFVQPIAVLHCPEDPRRDVPAPLLGRGKN